MRDLHHREKYAGTYTCFYLAEATVDRFEDIGERNVIHPCTDAMDRYDARPGVLRVEHDPRRNQVANVTIEFVCDDELRRLIREFTDEIIGSNGNDINFGPKYGNRTGKHVTIVTTILSHQNA